MDEWDRSYDQERALRVLTGLFRIRRSEIYIPRTYYLYLHAQLRCQVREDLLNLHGAQEVWQNSARACLRALARCTGTVQMQGSLDFATDKMANGQEELSFEKRLFLGPRTA